MLRNSWVYLSSLSIFRVRCVYKTSFKISLPWGKKLNYFFSFLFFFTKIYILSLLHLYQYVDNLDICWSLYAVFFISLLNSIVPYFSKSLEIREWLSNVIFTKILVRMTGGKIFLTHSVAYSFKILLNISVPQSSHFGYSANRVFPFSLFPNMVQLPLFCWVIQFFS